MENSFFVTLPEEVKNEHDSLLLSVYLAAQMNYLAQHSLFNEAIISPYEICYIIFKSDRQVARVKEKLEILSSMGILNNKLRNIYTADENSFNSQRYYKKINISDIFTIWNSGGNNRVDLLNSYVYMLFSIDFNLMVDGRRDVIGHMSIEYLCNEIGCSYNTLMSHLKTLEELKVLYINHTGQHKNNVYGRYADRSLIDSYIKNDTSHSSANFHRMVTQKYNHFINTGGINYTPEQIAELYQLCERFNRDMDELQLTQPGNDYIKRKKDLTQIKLP